MNLFLRADDVSASDSWRIASWCRAHGATEFSLELLGLQQEPEPFCDEVKSALQQFELDSALRPKSTWLMGSEPIQPTRLWQFTEASFEILQTFLRRGLFTYPAGEFRTGCIEDPTIYRAQAIILGVVSHEREAILTLDSSEIPSFRQLGIKTHNDAEWI